MSLWIQNVVNHQQQYSDGPLRTSCLFLDHARRRKAVPRLISGEWDVDDFALFRQLPAAVQRAVRKRKSSCTFLVDGACTVYEARPVICRTYGLPSLQRNEKSEAEISWCELNFTNVQDDFAFQADGIIDIDTLNAKLAGVNSLFLKESGSDQERIPMDEVPKLDPGILQRHN